MQDQIEKSPHRCLFWKDEILQVLFWMDGEGLGGKVTNAQLVPLLNSTNENLQFHLKKLVEQKILGVEEIDDVPNYSLTLLGRSEAAKRFSDAFQGLQKAGHGECGPDCEFCYGPDGVKLENCVHHCGSQD